LRRIRYRLTIKIRDALAQQVAAIESDEQDRPFDEWAEEEISGFKKFMLKRALVASSDTSGCLSLALSRL